MGSEFRPDWRSATDLPANYNDLPEPERERLHNERERLLHVYGAPVWHSDVRIVGNRNALTVVRDAIDAALRRGEADTEVMANDGEGYGIIVELDDNPWSHPSWETRPPHYTDPSASGVGSDEWKIPPLRDALRRANAHLVKRGVRPVSDPTDSTNELAP